MKKNPSPYFFKVSRKNRPIAEYKCSDAIISIYLAKSMFNKEWRHPSLKKLVLICRKTYNRYGQRDLLDEYDEKAAIYLACASYPVIINKRVYVVKEWLSVRIVPGSGNPAGCGELELYYLKGERLDKIIRDKFFGGKEDFWRNIVSGSRICGINPYIDTGYVNDLQLPARNKYTQACFALIFYQFILDGVKEFSFLTGIINNWFVEKKLGVLLDGIELLPFLTPAYQFLSLNDPRELKLDRNIYAYKFPTYWLNMVQLSSLLRDLIDLGHLTEKTFQFYLKTNKDIRNILSGQGPELSRLGLLLSEEGVIRYSRMTGPQLRQKIDERVEDSPELKITVFGLWNDSIIKIVEALKVLRI